MNRHSGKGVVGKQLRNLFVFFLLGPLVTHFHELLDDEERVDSGQCAQAFVDTRMVVLSIIVRFIVMFDESLRNRNDKLKTPELERLM